MNSIEQVEHDLSSFLQTWSFPDIVEKRADERMTREDMNHRLVRRIHGDALFRREFLAHPRFVFAIAVEQSLGIDKYAFVKNIERVEVLQETSRQLYLVLPACHRGCRREEVCEAPAEAVAGSCHVCGITFPRAAESSCSEQRPSSGTGAVSRREIEEQMTKRAGFDASFREALLTRPAEAYPAFARELCGGHVPQYLETVEDIRVLEEDVDEIYFRLPIRA